ncbi:hypothetical protein H5407_19815 [Mitsuaria sp. WAJ17]|uniref:GH36-type glycosyl hydrolase domain-containing protein n=1 Tax=Mitsuaria sp. WAJ17 TaxID=2761452 RepID=UPI00160058B2|nr:glucoamylase family protein [Mitsuaria sp. WAJ17]MBB2487487.1 hypothetical protein [Mitsuaria sp. WAJ17]
MLERARGYLDLLDREGEAQSPAAEWLLDNFHLVEAQLPEVRSGMPRGYYAQLPKLRQQPLAGLPRVYGIAWAFVAHTDSSFDPALLKRFLEGYQAVDVLTLGELWALPSTLRVVLMENLARLAEVVATTRAAQDAASWYCDQAGAGSLSQLEQLFEQVEHRSVGPIFLAQMLQRQRALHMGGVPPWSEWLNRKVPDAQVLLASTQAAQAADNVSVSNAVTALRKINDFEWIELVRAVSPVLSMLAQSPAFLADSELTQDAITHEIEYLARTLRRSELEVARQVMLLCQAPNAPTGTGPAHWAIGCGRDQLLEELHADPCGIRDAARHWLRRWRASLYGGALGLGAVSGLAMLFGRGHAGWLAAPALLLAAFPVLECVIALVHRMLAEAVQVQRLPRLALDEGLTPSLRTLVAVPCLLTSQRSVHELLQRLELHYLANPECCVQFALLSDWVDASQQALPEDATLLAVAHAGIARLNQRHPAPDGVAPRFLLLHRQRNWCEGEGVWMGWERKRGKVEQLLALLAISPTQSSFLDLGRVSRPEPEVRFAVVLDSDTELPPGSLREMVGIAAHPLNEPQVDAVTRRVVAGYGILQPRVAARFPQPDTVTPFGWMFTGPWGTDAYNSGCSEIYQDVFGEGSFCGKGLFNVQAVHEVLRDRAVPCRLLSHDLFEGLWARCAYLSDVLVLESHPMHPDVAASRTHRWTRGDWQLLAFMGAVLGGGVGGLNVWKILDNLRRSLLTPASVALLWLACTTQVMAPWLATATVMAALGLGPLMGALAGFVPTRSHIAWRHLLHEAARELGRAVAGSVYQTMTLMHAALLHVDAIGRTIWRLLVSKQGLLQWTTSAQAQVDAGHAWWNFWQRHALSSGAALAWWAAGMLVPGANQAWLSVFGLLWLATPAWLWTAARPLRPIRQRLSPAERSYLEQVARDTWRYFDEHVGDADHDLPPDNLQLEPRPMLAGRTSPTNIGLYLLSCACAHRLGLIEATALGGRIDRCLATMDRLPRHRGHLFNWTDTRTLEALTPHYVSAVDSGNLAACLWAVAQACRELGVHEPEGARWRQRARRADAMVAAMNFSFLYAPKRRLFHIGFRLDDASLDPAYYDLLASEARLTSLVAIAKGDVPRRHWEALGRPFLAVKGQPALRSWSGSMFEYLMPALLLEEPEGGLLQRVSVAALQAHLAFGATHRIPWGVSECAYFAQDHTLAFQYAPFGVPGLALRRTPVEDRVVAPYATALATLVDAPSAILNLRRLEQLDGRGRYGFIEALDFTQTRIDSKGPQHVRTFMAHHQGMSLVALTNVLCENAARHWFSQAPQVQAFASLLHERMPREIALQEPIQPRAPHLADGAASVVSVREFDRDQVQGARATQCLSNGGYAVTLRPNGAGTSSWRGNAISRTRDDALRDMHGLWLLARLQGEAQFHSLTQMPSPRPHMRYAARFFSDHVEFLADCDEFEALISVWVAPDDDIEFRQLTLHNRREEVIELELMSYFEAVLAPQAADEAHPAFSNLFVMAQAVDPHALLLERRPRLPDEPSVWAIHFLGACDTAPDQVVLCCDREQMLPRGTGIPAIRPGDSPAVAGARLSTGLDPAASVGLRLRLPPRARASLTFATAAASDKARLLALMDEYRQSVHMQSARTMAAALARIRRRELGLDASELHAAQDLAGALVQFRGRLRPLPPLAVDRRALWRFGVSGDRPIVLVRVSSPQGLPAIRALMAVQRLWEFAGVPMDLVILNGEPASYLMPLQTHLTSFQHELGSTQHEQPVRASVQLLREGEVSAAELCALMACARLELHADGRTLERMVTAALGTLSQPDSGEGTGPPPPHTTPLVPDAWAPNRFGDEGRSFLIDIDAAHVTPRPWSNVLANPQFGCLVTESGGGFTWALNSRLNQLTPWSNDALLDPPSEHFLVRDLDSGQVFGVLPTMDRNGAQGYRVRHTQGSSEFQHLRDGLLVRATIAVDPLESVKCIRVQVRNNTQHRRRLQWVACVEWVLGAQRRDRMTLGTESMPDLHAVLARQLDHQGGFGDGCAFLALSGARPGDWTCSREAFLDLQGRVRLPRVLGRVAGVGLDPCGALAADVEVGVGETRELCWMVGYAPGREAALALLRRMLAPGVLSGLPERAMQDWDKRLSRCVVHSPDPCFDAMVNRWWPYQAVACRLWARAGFYQAGGAFGFRDQLQDALALAWTEPSALREQILLHASRQFPEGDVQHWWHVPGGAGVRTRFSDDLLWLPFAVMHYLECTADTGVLDADVPFIDGQSVPAEAEDAYFVPGASSQSATLYEHCVRAIDHALRFGEHGLPLMGTGDWNDGMNRVGHEGRGESVWLGWFLLRILSGWAPVASWRHDDERAQRWSGACSRLRAAMQRDGWDGHWYLRAYFDNGHALGSQVNVECRIDLIAQAWSVLASEAPDPRARQAMDSVDQLLVDRRLGLIRLFDPPLQRAADNAGYVQAYPPGVRENGGQYAHAGAWALLAQARLGDPIKAWEYFRMLSPAHRATDESAQRRYRLEPYVMPGDVYSEAPYEGRGGWSWYTGSAAWMWRASIEGLIGLSVRADALQLCPCLPPSWQEVELTLVIAHKAIRLRLQRLSVALPSQARPCSVGQWVPLADIPENGLLCWVLPPS